jgi:hypothetical protein
MRDSTAPAVQVRLVLVLTQDYLQRAIAVLRGVAAKVLFNLSLILRRRLKDSTKSWLAARAA